MSVKPTGTMPGAPDPVSGEVIALARHLADAVMAGGAIALNMRRSGLSTWTKDNNSPVTDADIAVDKFLRERLMAIDPAFGWLSEETADSPARLAASRVWVVDPIDGTRAFMAGEADWTVSAALVENGRPIAAALFAPVSDELFLAARGQGATRNAATIRGSGRTQLEGASVSGPAPEIEAFRPKVALERQPRVRSLALRLARVASGELDLALAGANACDWDIAAADLIVEEAAGRLTGYEGTPLVYNTPVLRHGRLICAGLPLHAAALAGQSGAATPPTPPDQQRP